MREQIAWRRRGLVQVAAPAVETERKVHDLVACPTCRARVDECCRTPSGHTRPPHKSRLAPRLCPCGAPLARRRRYCDPCRDRIDKENRYAGVVRHRARKKEVA